MTPETSWFKKLTVRHKRKTISEITIKRYSDSPSEDGDLSGTVGLGHCGFGGLVPRSAQPSLKTVYTNLTITINITQDK